MYSFNVVGVAGGTVIWHNVEQSMQNFWDKSLQQHFPFQLWKINKWGKNTMLIIRKTFISIHSANTLTFLGVVVNLVHHDSLKYACAKKIALWNSAFSQPIAKQNLIQIKSEGCLIINCFLIFPYLELQG